MASKALASVKSWLAKLPIKAPWKVLHERPLIYMFAIHYLWRPFANTGF